MCSLRADRFLQDLDAYRVPCFLLALILLPAHTETGACRHGKRASIHAFGPQKKRVSAMRRCSPSTLRSEELGEAGIGSRSSTMSEDGTRRGRRRFLQ